MRIATDRRELNGEPDPEADAQLRADRGTLRGLQVRIAKNLARVERGGHFLVQGCASVMEYGARLGYDPSETRRLCDLGLAIAALPELEQDVMEGRVWLEKAAAIGPVVSQPALVRDGERWNEYARNETPSALRRRVRRRLAEAAMQQARLAEVTVFVPEETKDDFDRCRDIASRKADRSLSHDETFGAVVGHYLDCQDPMRRQPGTRRLPDTSCPGAPGGVERALEEFADELARKASGAESSAGPAGGNGAADAAQARRTRAVAEEVKRWIRAVAGDRCEVPGCTHHQFLQFCHRIPFALGGSQERDNMFLACPRHHLLHDAGRIAMLGRDEWGRGVFRLGDGTVLRHPPPPPEGPALAVPVGPPSGPGDRVAEGPVPYLPSRTDPGRECLRGGIRRARQQRRRAAGGGHRRRGRAARPGGRGPPGRLRG